MFVLVSFACLFFRSEFFFHDLRLPNNIVFIYHGETRRDGMWYVRRQWHKWMDVIKELGASEGGKCV